MCVPLISMDVHEYSYLCMYMCMYVHLYVCTCICMLMGIATSKCTCVYVHVYVCTFIGMHVDEYLYVHVYPY